MNVTAHPSQFIATEIVEQIRNHSAEAEAVGQLHTKQLETIYLQNWFNLFVPKEYGGLGFDFIAGLNTQEALAWVDGSVGWTVTLCSGANYFIGFLDPQAAKDIFHDPYVCLAGSGHPSGTAKKVNDGYEVNGRWKYATGAPFATVFTALCTIEEGEERKEQACWFYKEEVIIHKDWNASGMIATATHSFEVKNRIVPPNRFFIIDPSRAVLPDPVYQYPFLQFAEATLAVNMSGMATRFIDLAGAIFEQKQRDKNKVDTAANQLNNARSSFYNVINRSWEELLAGRSIPQKVLKEVSYICRNLASIARQQVDELYPYCGLIAATPSSAINRVWRDLHTASQHPLLLLP